MDPTKQRDNELDKPALHLTHTRGIDEILPSAHAPRVLVEYRIKHESFDIDKCSSSAARNVLKF